MFVVASPQAIIIVSEFNTRSKTYNIIVIIVFGKKNIYI